jgi:hypothetical protein
VSEGQYAAYKRSAALGRRTFSTNPRWNPSRLDKYLIQCDNEADAQFGENYYYIMNGADGESEPGEGTRSQEAAFKDVDEPFQIGCSGLHGCTVMTLASNRAVYMVS